MKRKNSDFLTEFHDSKKPDTLSQEKWSNPHFRHAMLAKARTHRARHEMFIRSECCVSVKKITAGAKLLKHAKVIAFV